MPENDTETEHAGHPFFGLVRIADIIIALPIDSLIEVFHIAQQRTLPTQNAHIIGGVDLRGHILPVLNVAGLCGMNRSETDGKLAVVVRYEDNVAAFHIDEVLGMLQVSTTDVQHLSSPHHETTSIFCGMVIDEGRLVSLMDVRALFALPGVCLARKRDPEATQSEINVRHPMLTFRAGGALFSAPAVEIYAAVPKQNIAQTAITSGYCLGEIFYHNKRIPVVNPAAVLGLGLSHTSLTSEIVVLRFPEGRMLGLAVDIILDIQSIAVDKFVALPELDLQHPFIKGVMTQSDRQQMYLVNLEMLRTDPALAEIATLALKNKDTTKTSHENVVVNNATHPSRVIHERNRYLVVDAGETCAIPIEQVVCILDPPQHVTPAHGGDPAFQGYFQWLSDSVALVDLRKKLGHGHCEKETRRLLLADLDGKKVAYCVDRVISIEVSQWREKTTDDRLLCPSALVQLGQGKSAFLLPQLNLTQIEPQPAAA